MSKIIISIDEISKIFLNLIITTNPFPHMSGPSQ